MEFLNFDDYFYEVWNCVPIEVVNENTYERNKNLIKEMTYGLWEIYKKTFKIEAYEIISTEMSVERAAKILTNVFESVTKIGLRI